MNRRFALAIACLALVARTPAADAQIIPQIPAPTLISPSLSVGVPILFQWTPVNPGNVYNFVLQSRSRTQAVGPLIVTYELQVSDEPDVASHVLVDVTTSVSLLSFQNQNIPGSGFTNLQQPGIGLPGGVYYWRVRALINTTPTAFSSIGRFSLDLRAGGGSSSPLHDVSITALAVTIPPYVGSTSAIVTTVQNTGTFPEETVPLVVTVNGIVVARLTVPPTASGDTIHLTTLWTPVARGQAQVTAVIDFSGQNSRRKIASISPLVGALPEYVTTMHGTLALGERGYFLTDVRGREITVVLLEPNVQLDLGPLLGKPVVVRGTLSKRESSFIMAINNVALAR